MYPGPEIEPKSLPGRDELRYPPTYPASSELAHLTAGIASGEITWIR